MLKILKRELNISIVASIIYIILGIFVVCNPALTMVAISTTFSIMAIMYGLIISIINIADIKEEGNLSYGILLIVVGIALLIYPSSLEILFSLGLGIWFISNSISRIKFAVQLKNVKEINWLLILCSAIITLLIGISFIFLPLASAVTLTMVSGIFMIVYSIFDIVEIIIIKKNIKLIEKNFEKIEKVENSTTN